MERFKRNVCHKLAYFGLAILFTCVNSYAQKANPHCIVTAARVNHISPKILYTFLYIEGGKTGTVHYNGNHTYDIGVMQINNIWLPMISKMHFHGDRAFALANLVSNGCYNVEIGAWILSQQIQKYGLMPGIGYYHSGNVNLRHQYQRLFLRTWNRLYPDELPKMDN